MKLKYITFKDGSISNFVIFTDLTTHYDMHKMLGQPKIIGAGFCLYDPNINWYCFGKSESLGVEFAVGDNDILNRLSNPH